MPSLQKAGSLVIGGLGRYIPSDGFRGKNVPPVRLSDLKLDRYALHAEVFPPAPRTLPAPRLSLPRGGPPVGAPRKWRLTSRPCRSASRESTAAGAPP